MLAKKPIKKITASSFRKTLLKGAKEILSDKNRFKGATKELSGKKLAAV